MGQCIFYCHINLSASLTYFFWIRTKDNQELDETLKAYINGASMQNMATGFSYWCTWTIHYMEQKRKRNRWDIILLASKSITYYPLLPLQKNWRKQKLQGCLQEWATDTIRLIYNHQASTQQKNVHVCIYRSTTHLIFISSSHSSLCSASFNVCNRNPTLFLNQQWVKVKNQLSVQPSLSNHNANLQ